MDSPDTPKQIEGAAQTKDIGRRVICPECGKLVDRYNLENHMSSRNCEKDERNAKVICPECGKEQYKSNLQRHIDSRNCRKDEVPVSHQVSNI